MCLLNRSSIVLLSMLFAVITPVFAQGVLPVFTCTLTSHSRFNDEPNVALKVFHSNAAFVRLICESNNVVKGDSIRAVLIGDDTTCPKWDNAVLSESKRVVRRDLNRHDLYKTMFTVRTPEGGWPHGTYHFRLFINDVEDYEYKFIIR